ncbi:exosporium leader peptide, partial [Bacillus thuringiensis]
MASGVASHAEGIGTIASGNNSHTEGDQTTASGINSHAEGTLTRAIGNNSHAEGVATTASGLISHAEGYESVASGFASHAEGDLTTASGFASHAEGQATIASGDASHAEGNSTLASAFHSHAEGLGNVAGFNGSHVMGRYGVATEAYSWFIGNGTSSTATGLGAKWLASTGNMYIDGPTYVAGGADYAEMFEVVEEPIDFGYFVTLEGEKIRKATAQDSFILGITSATPSVLGDSAEMSWQNKYVVDEWGQRQYEEVTIPAEKDAEGNVRIPERVERQPKINPQWDSSKMYQPRINRPEWVAVGLLGKILIRDDGSCQVNG